MTARSSRGRWFFLGMAGAMALTVFVGFAPTYYLRGLDAARALPPRVHVHSVLFTFWVLLFLAQSLLVSTKRTALHRHVGVLGAIVVVAMLVSGVTTAVAWGRQGSAVRTEDVPFDARLAIMVIPFASVSLFATLATLGVINRRRPDVHKRYMLLATIALLPPAFARMPTLAARGPAVFLGASLVFIVALLAYDYWTRQRVHPVSFWGGLCLAVSFPGRLALGQTEVWGAFARWLVG